MKIKKSFKRAREKVVPMEGRQRRNNIHIVRVPEEEKQNNTN